MCHVCMKNEGSELNVLLPEVREIMPDAHIYFEIIS